VTNLVSTSLPTEEIANLASGAQINEVGTVMATSPGKQFGGANADTPYAIATVDLESSGPRV
jgi:hypothetical protein